MGAFRSARDSVASGGTMVNSVNTTKEATNTAAVVDSRGKGHMIISQLLRHEDRASANDSVESNSACLCQLILKRGQTWLWTSASDSAAQAEVES